MEQLNQAKQEGASESIGEPPLEVGHGDFHIPSGPDPLQRFNVLMEVSDIVDAYQARQTEEFVLVELL